MDRPILVFGAAGQVGQELLGLAKSRSIPAVGLPRHQVDIANADSVVAALTAVGPAIVVNAAAYTKVDKAETDMEAATLANDRGPRLLARACHKAGIPLIHLSTGYVFDGAKDAPYRENDPIAPLSVYGRTKAAGEQAVRDELAEHVILRTNWVYGIHGTNFLKTMLQLASRSDELRIVADQWGNPTATADIAAAILAVSRRIATRGAAPWGTYHFGGTGETSWHGFATRILAARRPAGRPPAVRPIATSQYPTAARRPANSRLDSSRFAAAFGVVAKPWSQRVTEIVKSLQDQGQANR